MSSRSTRTTRLKSRNLRKRVQSKSASSRHQLCDSPIDLEDGSCFRSDSRSRYNLRRRSHSADGPCSSSQDPNQQPQYKRRKKSQTLCNPTLQPHGRIAARYLQHELPDEVMFYIFSFLKELDLCNTSQVCQRFRAIANDHELWKALYMEVFEYDQPLMNPEPCVFQFVASDDPNYDNPWKESFKHLYKYRGVHVSKTDLPLVTSDKGKLIKGRNITRYDTIDQAYTAAVDGGSTDTLIFVHTGTYKNRVFHVKSTNGFFKLKVSEIRAVAEGRHVYCRRTGT